MANFAPKFKYIINMSNKFDFLKSAVGYMQEKVSTFLEKYKLADQYDDITKYGTVDNLKSPEAIIAYINKIANNAIETVVSQTGKTQNEIYDAFCEHYLSK